MRKTLIFEETLTGHHLEYLHHYYLGAIQHQDEGFVFCVPKDFEVKKLLYTWEASQNTTFKYLDDAELGYIDSSNLLAGAWKRSLLLRRKAKEYKCNRILLTTLTVFLPFICFLIPANIKVSGIIYSIYLYNKRKWSNFRYRLEELRYWIVVHSQCMDKILILNDEKSCELLNKKFKTHKFTFLPDPVPVIDKDKLRNIRNEYSIPKNNEVFLHFGGLAKRKGTIEILQAIDLADSKELNNKTFIFAGRIYTDIHDSFYSFADRLKDKVQLIVLDEFCPYDLLFNLCYSSDVFLMPYHLTNLSSGVLGYASLFQKLVIGPSEGLLGQLIKKYELGITIHQITPDDILGALLQKNKPTVSTNYATNNRLKKFIQHIFDV